MPLTKRGRNILPQVDSPENLARALRAIFEKYGILKAVIFGSFARGETSRRSDLDILVVQETDKRFLIDMTASFVKSWMRSEDETWICSSIRPRNSKECPTVLLLPER